VEQRLVVLLRLAHQFQIAALTAFRRGHLGNVGSEVIYVSLGSTGIPQTDFEMAVSAASQDLHRLIQQLCVLYDVRTQLPPMSFQLKFLRAEGASSIPSDCTCIAFGRRPNSSGPCYVVQNLFYEGRLGFPVTPSTARYLSNPRSLNLRYFLNYLFRLPDFREGQLEALSRLLCGKDTIVLLPTGSGKSLIFQLAGLLLPGISVVVAPLIALIDDQIDNLSRQGIDRAVGITSQIKNQAAMSAIMAQFAAGQYLFTYVSPERFQTPGFRDALRQVTASTAFNLVAVDEAHCVSEWGHDFRTAYLNLARTARTYCRSSGVTPAIAALTGTASRSVLKDVQRSLEIPEIDAIITPRTFDRSNLRFGVFESRSAEKGARIKGILTGVLPGALGGFGSECYLARGRSTNAGICFCPHIKGEFGVRDVHRIVEDASIPSRFYAGGLERLGRGTDWDQYKRATMRDFKNNKFAVLVATKAAGMGLDKPNIRFTIHYGLPSSIEAFYQECGRAGRDGKPACNFLILSVDHAERAKRLLSPEVGLEEIRALMATVDSDWDSQDDVTRAVYFHVKAFAGIQAEGRDIQGALRRLTPLDQPRNVNLVAPNDDEFEKSLLRLLTIGVISDYTVDYGSREYGVTVAGATRDSIIEKYARYVAAYNRGAVRSEVASLRELPSSSLDEFVHGACLRLTSFIYQTIEKGRRRALREMLALGEQALTGSLGSEDAIIRQGILRYLETTYSEELEKVVQADDEGFGEARKLVGGHITHAGESIGGIRSAKDASELKGQVIRYLESQPDHPGLLLLRAISEALSASPDPEVVVENAVASYQSATARRNLGRRELAEVMSWALAEIHAARDSVYHDVAWTILNRLDDLGLANAILRNPEAEEDIALEPGTYLVTRHAANARTIFTEKDSP